MSELIDFVAFLKNHERPVQALKGGGVIVPFTGVRYSRLEVEGAENLSPQGAAAGAGKRRKGKSRQG